MKMPFAVVACEQRRRAAMLAQVPGGIGAPATFEVAKRLECVRLAGALWARKTRQADAKAAPRRTQSKCWREPWVSGAELAQSSCPVVARAQRRGERGSAVILVLVLAFIMAALISDNGLVLHRLKQEIKLIEKKQEKKYQPASQRKTRSVASEPVGKEPGAQPKPVHAP